jgi:hypothetical protein
MYSKISDALSFRTFHLTLVSALSRVHVLLLPGPAVLEPDLSHPLAQPRDLLVHDSQNRISLLTTSFGVFFVCFTKITRNLDKLVNRSRVERNFLRMISYSAGRSKKEF